MKKSSKLKRSQRVDRNANAQNVLSVLRRQGPVSQAEIVRATSLSRATINNIVQTLRDKGTVEYQWKNGREALVSLACTRGSVIAVRVGESAISASLFDFTKKVRLDIRNAELPEFRQRRSSPALTVEIIRHLIDVGRSRDATAIGFAIAIEAPIEKSTGAIAPWAWQRLPHWKGVDLQRYFGKIIHLPFIVDNDANLAALAEWSWGEGRGCDDFLHITCSEGVGGGIVLNGRIYRGGSGLAGEIGHMVVAEEGDLCFCGSRGCLSSFATERAILRALRNSEKPRRSLDQVVDSAREGDAACQRVLSEAGRYLGKALATVVRVFGPSVIAIGGTLARAGDIVLEGMRSSAEIVNLRAIGESPKFCVGSIIDGPQLGGVAALMTYLDLGLSGADSWMYAEQISNSVRSPPPTDLR